jgi:hypothetical protein
VVSLRTASLTFNNSTFCPHSVFVFFVDLRTNSDLRIINRLLFKIESSFTLCSLWNALLRICRLNLDLTDSKTDPPVFRQGGQTPYLLRSGHGFPVGGIEAKTQEQPTAEQLGFGTLREDVQSSWRQILWFLYHGIKNKIQGVFHSQVMACQDGCSCYLNGFGPSFYVTAFTCQFPALRRNAFGRSAECAMLIR